MKPEVDHITEYEAKWRVEVEKRKELEKDLQRLETYKLASMAFLDRLVFFNNSMEILRRKALGGQFHTLLEEIEQFYKFYKDVEQQESEAVAMAIQTSRRSKSDRRAVPAV